jgi:hypothetical protein
MFVIDGIENVGYDFGRECWETERPDFRKDANGFDMERKKALQEPTWSRQTGASLRRTGLRVGEGGRTSSGVRSRTDIRPTFLGDNGSARACRCCTVSNTNPWLLVVRSVVTVTVQVRGKTARRGNDRGPGPHDWIVRQKIRTACVWANRD